MSDQTLRQEAAKEARAACNKLSDDEKERLRLDALRYMDVAGVAIMESHLLRTQRDRAIRIAEKAILRQYSAPQLQEELRALKAEIG